LWCLAIRHAVLHGTLDVRSGLAHLSEERARVWADRLDEAEAGRPADFEKNGWVVHALQGAWSAITTTAADHDAVSSKARSSTSGPVHFRLALEAAVRGGRDTDTVAAIAGSLVGGLYGASAVPVQWRRTLHGWPGLRARDLVRLGVMTARGGQFSPASWPAVAKVDYAKYKGSDALAPHPYDDHVWIGGVESEPDKNPNLDFVLTDAVAAIEVLRAEGRTVLLHCVQAQSRTPAVAALYGARLTGQTPIQALADIIFVLPKANPNGGFRSALMRLG
jgi:ADP-ribosyl-[dinitrogen reductase] hydrolase